MKSIGEYFKSVHFSLGYAIRFVPKESFFLIIFAVVSSVLPYGSAYVLGQLVNSIVSGVQTGSINNIWYLLFFYAFLNALPSIIENARHYIDRHWWLKMSMEIELDIYRNRAQKDISTLEDPKYQDLLQRAFRNGQFPVLNLADRQPDVIRAILGIIIGTILAIHFSLFIYLIVIISAIPSFIIDIKYTTHVWGIWAKDSTAKRRFNNLLAFITGKVYLTETKLLQSGNKILNWMRQILSEFTENQLKAEKSKLVSTTIGDSIAFLGFAFGLFFVLRPVLDGTLQVGSLVYMLSTLSNVRSSISTLLSSFSSQFDHHLIIKDIKEVIDTKPVIIESKNPKILNLSQAPEIIFENVSFKYSNSEKWVLRHLNLTLKSGDNIGLVGNNGAGKTTLVKLLCRIYDPTEGKILINGIDLREIKTAEWWSYLGVMFQDYANYDFLAKEAIAIGRADKIVNLTKVIESAHVGQANTFIEEWKDKYDHQIGVEFGGAEPSKGQKQKLSISKIIYRDAFVMVLDEPTASVDAESEAKIFDSIENLSKDQTAIFISHDFSTISECDKIFVLDKGKLIEEGDHKELMKQKGLYAELYNLQAKRFKK